MKQTTCANYKCSHYQKCTVNIWDSSYKTRPCTQFDTQYMSQREMITQDYLKKKTRMPINIYWE